MSALHPMAAGAGLGPRRRWSGAAISVVAVAVLTLALLPLRGRLSLDTILLLYLAVAVVSAVIGGLPAAVLATVGGFLCANFFFVQPYHSLQIKARGEIVALVVFTLVTGLVTVLTEMSARARSRAERTRLHAELADDLSQRDLAPDSVPKILDETRSVFGMDAVSLTEGEVMLAHVGSLGGADDVTEVEAGDGLTMRLHGPRLVGHDQRLLSMLALTAGRLYRTGQLAEQAGRAEELSRIDATRTALLAAVSHDLRTPLAGIKASVSTLRSPDLELDPADCSELMASIEDQADRLTDLVSNLLDMSRVQAGAVSCRPHPTDLAEVVAAMHDDPSLTLTLPQDLPLVQVDGGLLERALDNLVQNALKHGGGQVQVGAQRVGDTVLVRVVDHGPGVPEERYEEMFQPFQRLGDRSTAGTGLGLAIARGFVEAMGGTIRPGKTPGGGLTLTVTLPVAT